MFCEICKREPISNDDIFFDTSDSYSGRDEMEDRIDHIICIECISTWIESKGFHKINLIRRIGNPKLGSN